MGVVFQQLRCSQISTYTVKLPKEDHGLMLFKIGSTSQPVITCSILTIEALEQGAKYVQS